MAPLSFERLGKAVAQCDEPDDIDAGGVPIIERLGLPACLLLPFPLPRRNGDRARRDRLALGSFVAQQLLYAAHGIAFLVEQAVDSMRELDVGRTVIAPVPGALHRLQLGELRLPVTQDVLSDAQLLRQFADRL